MTELEVLESGPISLNSTTQLGELKALISAIELSKGRRVNIYLHRFQIRLPHPPWSCNHMEGMWLPPNLTTAEIPVK